MDWGLFRSSNGLRDSPEKHKFPQSFYYFAMITNALIRFYWIIGVFHYEYTNDDSDLINKLSLMAMISLMLEAVRRTQWALIRVENEFYNNYENYRTISQIPDLMGKIEKIDPERVKKLIEHYYS